MCVCVCVQVYKCMHVRMCVCMCVHMCLAVCFSSLFFCTQKTQKGISITIVRLKKEKSRQKDLENGERKEKSKTN